MMKYVMFAIALVIFCSNASAQKVGGKVKVLESFTHEWKGATLLSIKKGTYLVHFDEWQYDDKLITNENEIMFIDGDDRKPLHDTIYLTKVRVDTFYSGKVNPAIVLTGKAETIYQTMLDTVIVQRDRTDTIYNYKRDTITIIKTKRDTVFQYGRFDTIRILKTKRDTVYDIKHVTVTVPKTVNDTVTSAPAAEPIKFKVGARVMVDAIWPWPAQEVIILEVTDDAYKVHYVFYNQDKWVGLDKVKRM